MSWGRSAPPGRPAALVARCAVSLEGALTASRTVARTVARTAVLTGVLTGVLLATSIGARRLAAQEAPWRPSRCLADTSAATPLLLTPPPAPGVTTDTATDSIAPGVTYSCRRVAGGPWLLHVVSIDLRGGRYTLDAERATGRMHGRERVSDMAARLAAGSMAPLVMINADFFDLRTGEIENNHVEAGEWVKGVVLSDSPHDEFDNAHSQLAIDTSGRPAIGRHQLDGRVMARGGQAPLIGINYRPPRDAGLVLYTPWFGARTPHDSASTDSGSRPVDPDSRPPGAARDTTPPRAAPSVSQLRADSARHASLAATREAVELPLRRVGVSGDTILYEVLAGGLRAGGGAAIPAGGAVLSATGEARAFLRATASTGGRLRIVARLAPGDIVPWAVVGGWPGVVRDGVNVGALADSLEGTFPRFSAARHPRSAVAVTRDSATLLLVVVDGRRPWSVGMSLTELADQLIALGAWQAMNFDGGGSSALWVKGTVVNYPSDPTGERAVGNALVVYPSAPRRP